MVGYWWWHSGGGGAGGSFFKGGSFSCGDCGWGDFYLCFSVLGMVNWLWP